MRITNVCKYTNCWLNYFFKMLHFIQAAKYLLQ